MIIAAALLGFTAHGQTALDQDPKERALSEALFSHPPVSSLAPAIPTPTPVPAPTAIPSPTPVPDLLPFKPSARISIQLTNTPENMGRRDAHLDRWYTFGVDMGTLENYPVTATLQIVLLDNRLRPVVKNDWPVTLKPVHANGFTQFSMQSDRKGIFRDWVARLTGSDGKLLEVKSSDPQTGENATRKSWWGAVDQIDGN